MLHLGEIGAVKRLLNNGPPNSSPQQRRSVRLNRVIQWSLSSEMMCLQLHVSCCNLICLTDHYPSYGVFWQVMARMLRKDLLAKDSGELPKGTT